ncbi:MAG: PLP-dependent aminotransferase family protein [Bacillota bacterium]
MEYSKHMNNIKASEIREILKLTQKPNIISFAGGLPAPELFPTEEMKEIVQDIMDSDGQSALQYSTTAGYSPLREEISKMMKKKNIGNINQDNILITSGSQQGLNFSGKIFLNKDDIVLVESPSYLGAINAFRANEGKFIEIETDNNGMIMSDLEEKIKNNENVKMIYVIPDFQNPSGKTWSLERRKKLIEIGNKYDLPIIEDNPYGELRYEGKAIDPIKAFDTEDRVIYLGTFSKTFCPGLRIGWVLASDEIVNKYNLVKQGADLHTSSLAQREIYKFLTNYDFEAHIQKLIEVYKKRRDVMLDSMGKYFPDNIKYTIPEGGLFTWVVLPEYINTKEMMKEAVNEGVAYVPGESFYPSGTTKNAMRLNFSNMNEAKIVKGIEVLGNVINKNIK